MEKNLTTGSVFKTVVFFSLPYFLSYFLQTLYGMADLFIVGQYEGVASTTAVSVGSQLMHMLTVVIVGLAMGSTVSIGQAIGANDTKKAGQQIGRVGSTGISTGPHLDMQAWKDGQIVDPLTIIPGYGEGPSGYVYDGTVSSGVVSSGASQAKAAKSSGSSGGSSSNNLKKLKKLKGFGT